MNIISFMQNALKRIRGSLHYWESELTFGNLTNFWKLANQKVS